MSLPSHVASPAGEQVLGAASGAAAWLAPLAALAAAAGATWALARAARRLGWTDPSPGGSAAVLARKLQAAPVPAVGGAAVLVAWIGATLLPGGGVDAARSPFLAGLSPMHFLPGLLAAFLVGWIDDRRAGGLSARDKLIGQALAGAALALPVLLVPGAAAEGALPPLWTAAALWLGAVAAQNALNAFDHADGTATSVSLAALAGSAPVAAAALAGFLPFNLGRPNAREVARGGAALPQVYLGDAGTHWLGALMAVLPAAWPALLLPVMDLSRVAAERWRCGQAPWVGDRRHLAHRLAARGLGRLAVVTVVVVIALPATVMGGLGVRSGPGGLALVGCALTVVLYALAIACTREPARGAGATAAAGS